MKTIPLRLAGPVLLLVLMLFSAATVFGQTNSGVLPSVSIKAIDPHASEVSPLLDIPENPGIFRITRSVASPHPLLVNYRIGGTASNGVDYAALSGSVTISSNTTFADIPVEVLDDALVEGDETVVLTLRENVAYAFGDFRQATVVIADNDHSNTPPSVQIVEPTNGTVFTAPANITIFANATDDGYVATVEFFQGTNSLGIATNNPASASPVNPFHLTWTNVPAGEYVLTAKATDDSGLTAISDPVKIFAKDGTALPIVTVHATDANAAEIPPWVLIPLNPGIFTVTRNPGSSQPLIVNYGLEGTAKNGVDYISLSGSITIPSNAVSANIYLVALDDSLVEGTENVILVLRTNSAYHVGDARLATVVIEDNDRVTNSPPTVHIISPTNNATFFSPADILIAAEAGDANGHVARVDFFVGDKFLGSDSSAPYAFSWTNVPSGSYNLSARATDDGGASQFSSPVHVTVHSPNEVAFVKRRLPMWYVPGVKVVVQLRAEPRMGTTSYSVEEQPPDGWAVNSISDGGSYDSESGTVRFGPFNDGLARTLTYEVTPPFDETGEQHFKGTATANEVTTPIGGVHFILPAPKHPADNDPANFVITEKELAGYVAAWRRCDRWSISPSLIPISYVTRAGFLFESGGAYRISTKFPTPLPPLLWVPANVAVSLENDAGANDDLPWRTDWSGRAVSAMPTDYFPGVPFTVTLKVAPSSNTLAYAIEDRPPEGWAVTNISDDGVVCPVTHKIRWGLFQDNAARIISYQVVPRPNWAAAAIARFSGVASFNGINVPITGQRTTRYSAGTNSPLPVLSAMRLLSDGDRLITFRGEPGVFYVIEASTDLIEWKPLDELLNNDGVLQYIDASSENFDRRMYRAVPLQ